MFRGEERMQSLSWGLGGFRAGVQKPFMGRQDLMRGRVCSFLKSGGITERVGFGDYLNDRRHMAWHWEWEGFPGMLGCLETVQKLVQDMLGGESWTAPSW